MQVLLILFCSLMLSFFSFVSPALASAVGVQVRSFRQACSYYDRISADFKIQYVNSDLKWGTRVFLKLALSEHYASSFRDKNLEWQFPEEVELEASSPYTWSTEIRRIVGQRTSSILFNQFVFVLRLQLPDGQIVFDQGDNRPWSFYQVEIPEPLFCVDQVQDIPNYTQSAIQIIRR